jgi:glycosyltransferase involved in cell wall biosynthesis
VWALHESFTPPLFWSTVYPPAALHPYPRARGEQALGSASVVLFEAEATRRLYLPYADSKRLVTLPYGVDLNALDAATRSIDRASARRSVGLDDDAQVLLCLGAIEPRKSQAMLAQAFARLATKHPRAQLVLVGATEDAYCAEYIAALRDHVGRVRTRVRIEPVTADPYPWHAAADVLVCASDIESLPRAVLEAMACGTPVVSTRVFGVPEVIEDERTGFLCDMRDLEDMSRALDRALGASQAERSAIGRAASAHVRARHDPDAYTAKVARLLEALASDADVSVGDVLLQPQAAA